MRDLKLVITNTMNTLRGTLYYAENKDYIEKKAKSCIDELDVLPPELIDFKYWDSFYQTVIAPAINHLEKSKILDTKLLDALAIYLDKDSFYLTLQLKARLGLYTIQHTKLDSPEGNVWKHLFDTQDSVYEAVAYKYGTFEDRTVICCSTQSGCKVGCVFCGTGKKFIRDLTADEIVHQVRTIINTHKINTPECKKFQIMFMSMGEPFHNYIEVREAMEVLNKIYPNAQLLISTSGVRDFEDFSTFVGQSSRNKMIGLQFSVHASTNEARKKIIPYKDAMTLEEIREKGELWAKCTGRQVYLNYCVNGANATKEDFERLSALFNPEQFAFTFSVICSKDETMKEAGYRDLDTIRAFEQMFLEAGYNTRIFDPAGQDSIGGGCGMLWHVQKKMKELGIKPIQN